MEQEKNLDPLTIAIVIIFILLIIWFIKMLYGG